MNIISFEKPICFINSSQKKNFEDYIEKYDYILTIEISKDNNLFSTITNNDTINLVIDADMLKDSFKNTKLNNLNEECLMNGIDKTYDIFNKRILEILSIKLFGNANYKVVLDNKNNEYINDIFIENIILNLNKYNNELINIIGQSGVTLVLCDGGSKKNEFNLISSLLKKGDVIMAHDYAPNEIYFQEHIKNKLWNWLEIQDSDINESCINNNLKPYMEEDFRKVVWVCKIKE